MPPKRKQPSKKVEAPEETENSKNTTHGEIESKETAPKEEEVVSYESEPKPKSQKLSIYIEHSKECNCFKTRAAKMEKAFKDMGHSVTINKEKPRKGAFVVTIEGREKPFFELLNMPRPFTKLKGTDLDAVIASLK